MATRTKKSQTAKKAQSKNGGKVTLRLVRYLPPDLVTHFVDGMLVTHTASEFAISFLQTQYPLASGPEELSQVENVVSKCVARVIVTPKHMGEMLEVLQRNFVQHQKSLSSGE